MRPHDVRLSHGRVSVVDAGGGEAILLLHGLGGSWRNWVANLPALAERHRVIALDLPGFGASAPYVGAVSMERYADTIAEFLDVLGIKRATLVGNSMGGLLAIETATRHPDRLSAAVLVSCGGIPLTSRRHRLITVPLARVVHRLMRSPHARRAVVRSSRVRRLIGGRLVHDPDAVPRQILAAALSGLGAPGFRAALAAGMRYDARLRAPLVACPALVLWGRNDRLLPVSMGEQLARLVPSSRLVLWDSTGHCPMLEHPARFDELVGGFVSEIVEQPA